MGPATPSRSSTNGQCPLRSSTTTLALGNVWRGWTLARAHARSGDPVAIAEYLGEDDQFDRSISDFAQRYADQNERDYQAFTAAVRSGRLAALEGA
jgi:hypothetical protein